MRTMVPFLAVILVTTAVCVAKPETPESENEGKRTAPFFIVDDKEGVDSFPLLRTEAKVNIAGVIADVELTQVYKNDGNKTIEAVYVFPLGTKSAIHAMRMKIDDRIIEAEIHEKDEAKKIYDAAKEEGKITSLLEQKRPNVFKMNVANIMPGDVVNVAVKYTELLVPDEGTYEYVFPTVVGPRFTGESSEGDLNGKDKWVATPYHKEGEEPSYAFNIEVDMDTGMPIARLDVPSHKVNVEKPRDADTATVKLAPEERKSGNKDFILKYSLQGERIHSGLLLYPGEKENFFLLMMEPPKSVDVDMVPPREYLFIVDVSGSMNGFPLDTSKTLIREMLNGLRQKDCFNILFFAGGANVLSEEPLPVTEGNIEKAVNMLNSQRGGGGTRILNAMQRASKLKKKEGVSRIIIAATDGYVSVEKATFDLIRDKLNEANFFAFGIGRSVNRYLIEGMARVGNGQPFVVTDGKEAQVTAGKFMEYIQYPLLTDIEVAFEGFSTYDVEPPSLPDLFSQRPLIFFGKYEKPVGKIIVSGKTAGENFKREFEVNPVMENKKNTAIRYLWARKKLELLSDYACVGAANREEITNIGLKYHLMTEYTSFVAVDRIVRDTGEVITVKQPLPLPEGVSNLAVGGVARKMAFSARIRPSSAPVPAPPGVVTKPAALDAISGAEKTKDHDKLPEITVTGGSVPQGTSLKEVAELIKEKLGDQLKKKLAEWGITELVIEIRVQSGKVTDVGVLSYKGKRSDEKVLGKLFKKLVLPGEVTGTITLTMIYR